MSPKNPRVSDGDKRRARDVVEQALASGRIIQADRDMRMSQIDNAQSVDELRMLTHDLDRSAMFGGAIDSPSPTPPPAASPPPPAPPAPNVPLPFTMPPPASTPPPPAPAPVPGTPTFQPTFSNVPYGSPSMMADEALEGIKTAAGTTAKSAGRSCLGCLLALVILVVVVAVPALFFVGDIRSVWHDAQDAFDSASENSGTGSPEEPPDVLSKNGWDDLTAGVKAATGRTEVFMVVAYPTYASVTATVDATSDRSQTLYWDGSFDGPGTTSTSSDERIDMADIKGQTLVRLVARARKLVENPTSWYVVVEAPVFENASILAFASNDAGDTSTIFATSAGKVVSVTRP